MFRNEYEEIPLGYKVINIECFKCNRMLSTSPKDVYGEWSEHGTKFYTYGNSEYKLICCRCYESRQKPSLCWLCVKGFPSRNKLFQHLRDTHPGFDKN